MHLGGEYGPTANDRGFRINTHTRELTDFIDEVRLRAQKTKSETELVINGDFVDFLAEKGPDQKWHAFITDEEEAAAVLSKIVERDASLFAAIGELVRSGVSLTLLLGNHDVELSLPFLRQELRRHLNIGRSHPFQFIHDGEAYALGEVLIEHGNRNDGWNVVDFDALRRRRSIASRHIALYPDAEFYPPPGSSLVEQVMNPIKVDYPFIDLLKPEAEAAIPLLLAFEPSLARNVDRIERFDRLRTAAAKGTPRAPAIPSQPGNISSGGQLRDSVSGAAEQTIDRRLDSAARTQLLALIAEAEQEQKQMDQQIAAGGFQRALSFARMLFTNGWEKRLPLLLPCFRQIQNVRLFGRTEETETAYLEAANELARGGFSTILFGHTHYAKDLELASGGKYLNTGTWADRIRLPEQVVSGSDEDAVLTLRKFANAIRLKDFTPYINFEPTYAHIQLDESGCVKSAAIRDYYKGSLEEL